MAEPPASPDSPEVLARVRDSMGLVDALARQVQKQISLPMTLDELRSYGHEGLLSAARSFDPTRGVPFGAWATLRVRGTMIDGVRATGTLPRRLYQKLRAMEAADAAQAGLVEEDAARPAATPADADARLSGYMTSIATAMALSYVATNARADAEDEHGGTPEEQVGDREVAEALRAAVSRLPDSERKIVERHYFGEVTVDEAAAELGLSKSWGSRLHARAVEMIARDLKRSRVAR